VVTGGATGIGKACAASFVADGDRVVLIGRREDVLGQAADDLGPMASWRRADVGSREDVEAAVASIAREHGTIHVLVNSAAISNRPVSTKTPLADAERIWDEYSRINVKGTLLMSLACAPHLARPGGRVILISSGAVFTGGVFPGLMAYAASKAALHGMMRSLARELGPDGITVNTVAPGFIAETEMTAGIPESDHERLAAATVTKRIGHPEDIAAAVRYLSSPEAAFVSTQVLQVDGGRLPG
jgi:3-oxoacyl-[acyl-carrier protein] reductase